MVATSKKQAARSPATGRCLDNMNSMFRRGSVSRRSDPTHWMSPSAKRAPNGTHGNFDQLRRITPEHLARARHVASNGPVVATRCVDPSHPRGRCCRWSRGSCPAGQQTGRFAERVRRRMKLDVAIGSSTTTSRATGVQRSDEVSNHEDDEDRLTTRPESARTSSRAPPIELCPKREDRVSRSAARRVSGRARVFFSDVAEGREEQRL
jgi:hypothetical protein